MKLDFWDTRHSDTCADLKPVRSSQIHMLGIEGGGRLQSMNRSDFCKFSMTTGMGELFALSPVESGLITQPVTVRSFRRVPHAINFPPFARSEVACSEMSKC